jgi:anti-sigma factor RsiW
MRINRLSPGLQNEPELYTFNDNRMNTEVTIEDRLWDFIDGLSSPAEKSVIETLIAENVEWQRKYKELLNVHQLMAGSELEEPSMRFTRNVMEEIARHQVAPATKTYINKNIIRGIGAFFLSLIAGLLVFFFATVKLSSGSSTSSKPVKLPTMNLEALDKVDYGKLSGNLPVTLFMLITVVMGLVLLDLYLRRKKEQVS